MKSQRYLKRISTGLNTILHFGMHLKGCSCLPKKWSCYEWITLLISLFTIVLTIVAICIAYSQLVPELKQLNEQAQISLSIHPLQVHTQTDGKILGPYSLTIDASNNGDYIPTYFRAVIFFCDDIEIVSSDSKWVSLYKGVYATETDKPIIPGLGLYVQQFDSIGSFTIKSPALAMYSLDRRPHQKIAILQAGGDRTVIEPLLIELVRASDDSVTFVTSVFSPDDKPIKCNEDAEKGVAP